MKRLPNEVDKFQAELAIRVQDHPNDEKVLQLVREALSKLDGLINAKLF